MATRPTPTQLLDSHLDNIGIALRKTKPTVFDDFPAVRRYEAEIKDLPIEHLYRFDSTGMPIAHFVGNGSSVETDLIDRDLEAIAENLRPYYRKFFAPTAVETHNHPTAYHPAFANTPPADRYSPLSLGDYKGALQEGTPLRAVNAEYQGGKVFEFNPGIATYEGVRPIVHGNPKGFHRNLEDFERAMQNQTYYQMDEWGDEYPITMTEFNKPTIKTYNLPQEVDRPIMVTDSFRFKR